LAEQRYTLPIQGSRGRKFLAATLLLLTPHAVSSGEPVAALRMFAFPPAKLRTAPAPARPTGGSGLQATNGPASGEMESFSLRVGNTVNEIERDVLSYRGMNGRSLLRAQPMTQRPTGVRKVFDLVLPPNTVLFQGNPNARRNPLNRDQW